MAKECSKEIRRFHISPFSFADFTVDALSQQIGMSILWERSFARRGLQYSRKGEAAIEEITCGGRKGKILFVLHLLLSSLKAFN